MTCGIDGNNTNNLKLTLNLDEADVVIAALAQYEVGAGQIMAGIREGGGNQDTSLMYSLMSKFQPLAVSVGKTIMVHREIMKVGK